MANPPLDRCHKVENWSNLKLILINQLVKTLTLLFQNVIQRSKLF